MTDKQSTSTINRRAILAGIAVGAMAAPALALESPTEACNFLPQTEQLRALDREFAAAFERANTPGSAAEARAGVALLEDLDKQFATASNELWDAVPQNLDDFVARGVCVSHYERDMRGPLVTLFRAQELRRSHRELARAVLDHLAGCWRSGPVSQSEEG